MRAIKYKAWDEIDKVMLTMNEFSSYHGCDSSDGRENRHDKRAIMTWAGHSYEEGALQKYIMLQYTGLKTQQGRVAEIFESDLLRYKGKLWRVDYIEDYAGYMLVRTEFEFGENEEVSLDCDVAFEADLTGNSYVNPEIMQKEKEKFLHSKEEEKNK